MTTPEHEHSKVIHRGAEFAVTPANGVTGVLLRSFCGYWMFRVHGEDGCFVDYRLRHDDMEVTISEEELATFYVDGDDRFLDHSPQVLGLKHSAE